VAKPQKGDKRFLDAEWTENPVFDVMKQSYLLTSNWLNQLVASAEDVEPLAKRRVEFFTKLLTDAFSPSNFLASNPAALRTLMATGGESLVKGAERFAEDLERGGGRLAISQTDYERFKVGENVATAPGKVVFQNDLFQLIQYSPTTEQVHETPLLIFPPWINKFYILDLKPENSMIRWLVGQGFTVFLTSWVNPGPNLAGKTMENYVFEGAYTAIVQTLRQSGATHVNTVGYCVGGTMLACALAHMAARGLEVVSGATFFAAQQDFTEAGDLLLFVNDEWLADLEKRMDAAKGVLPSEAMADTFNMLRANDLIWSFFVNNYLLGKEPAAFDLLFWNSDQTRMPKALHLGYLRQFYQSNLLSKGELKLGGTTLDLKAVKTPVYIQASREDHIAPLRSVYRGAKLFGGEVRFTLAGSGHIAGVINPPAANKYQHWINTDLPDTVEAWMAEASEHKGSWWPDWSQWLGARSGPLVPARDPASGPLPVIEDAPGSYVKVRSGE
jgi:polyhydroxyalkanoate synthase subunit PhaC